MLVTNKLNTGVSVKPDYKTENPVSANGNAISENRDTYKEAELILSDSARQKSGSYTDTVDVPKAGYQYTPQEAWEMIRTANAHILDHASEAVLAQANQDVRKTEELLSA